MTNTVEKNKNIGLFVTIMFNGSANETRLRNPPFPPFTPPQRAAPHPKGSGGAGAGRSQRNVVLYTPGMATPIPGTPLLPNRGSALELCWLSLRGQGWK